MIHNASGSHLQTMIYEGLKMADQAKTCLQVKVQTSTCEKM
jgi:hypothetical protein